MTPHSHIARAQLEEMFDKIRRSTTWDIDGEMLWGYFFEDPRISRLQDARQELESLSYRFVHMFELEQDGEPSGVFMLHVERVETHSIDSLDIRNGELDALAVKYGLLSYDGMDVGPVPR